MVQIRGLSRWHVGLTKMAATPRRQRLFCSGTTGWGYEGWFSPNTGHRSGLYVYPFGVALVLTCSGSQVTKPGYPGSSHWVYLVISFFNPWYQKLSSFQVDSGALKGSHKTCCCGAAARQPGVEMNETYGMSTSEGISQDNSVSNYCPDLSRVMQVWLLYPNSSRVMVMQI